MKSIKKKIYTYWSNIKKNNYQKKKNKKRKNFYYLKSIRFFINQIKEGQHI